MNIFDARNPHMIRTQSTLDARNPSMRNQPSDPRHYVSEYVFQEFPKWVQLADGTGVIVENAMEEAAARGEEAFEDPKSSETGLEKEPALEKPASSLAESLARIDAPLKRGRPSKAELEARTEREKLLAQAEREEAEGQ